MTGDPFGEYEDIGVEGPPPYPWSFWFALALGLTLVAFFVVMIWWPS